jgi:hypothetical protein
MKSKIRWLPFQESLHLQTLLKVEYVCWLNWTWDWRSSWRRGGLKQNLSLISFCSKTVNHATLQPSKDLIEVRFILKAYYNKVA